MDPFNLLANVKTIAIVGLSNKPDRPSYEVASYLLSQGFKIIPINPNEKEVLGEKAYPDLLSVPLDMQIDIVDIFRRSEDVMPHVKEAVARGEVKTIWMQEGVINEDAKKYAQQYGLNVIMNFCLMKTHKRKVKGQNSKIKT
ncbi:MAG: CoA-binding protein [Candidatus Levybacteria bacterium]|nr:CoA-binding protein [Candidatus Levybacteria bacterium]